MLVVYFREKACKYKMWSINTYWPEAQGHSTTCTTCSVHKEDQVKTLQDWKRLPWVHLIGYKVIELLPLKGYYFSDSINFKATFFSSFFFLPGLHIQGLEEYALLD